MAWNPSPEVAIARDVARQLHADRVVVIYTTPGGQCGSITYGANKAKCDALKPIGTMLHRDAMEYFDDPIADLNRQCAAEARANMETKPEKHNG